MNPMSKLPLIDKRMKIIYLPDHLVSQHYPKDFWVSDIFSEGYNTTPKVTNYILLQILKKLKIIYGISITSTIL